MHFCVPFLGEYLSHTIDNKNICSIIVCFDNIIKFLYSSKNKYGVIPTPSLVLLNVTVVSYSDAEVTTLIIIFNAVKVGPFCLGVGL